MIFMNSCALVDQYARKQLKCKLRVHWVAHYFIINSWNANCLCFLQYKINIDLHAFCILSLNTLREASFTVFCSWCSSIACDWLNGCFLMTKCWHLKTEWWHLTDKMIAGITHLCHLIDKMTTLDWHNDDTVMTKWHLNNKMITTGWQNLHTRMTKQWNVKLFKSRQIWFSVLLINLRDLGH